MAIDSEPSGTFIRMNPRTARAGIVSYAWAVFACVAVMLVTLPLLGHIELANIVMLFLLVVAAVALLLGSGPAVLAAFFSVGLFDFFFVQPRFSMAVADSQYLITFAVMLMVGLVIGQLTARLREKAEQAAARATETHALYDLARNLAGTFAVQQVSELVAAFLERRLGLATLLYLPGEEGELVAVPPAATPQTECLEHVREVFVSGQAMLFVGRESHFEPGIALPLGTLPAVRGVLLAHGPTSGPLCAPEHRHLIDAVASLTAIAVERLHYSEVAQRVTVKMESERLRAALLSAVSHDLRTPLTVLVGLADSLALKVPPHETGLAATAGTIRDQALRLSEQVHKLLDMARLQTGKVVLYREWQPLEEVVGSMLSLLEPLAGSDRVRVGKLDGLPWLSLDAVLMERVLFNVLENALKYAPEGEIVMAAARQGDCVELTVSDAGPGIAAGDEERIFGLFERGRDKSSLGGSGLGLPICRAIINAHGGHIHAENMPGGGACFMISLPVGTPPALDPTDGN